MVCSQAASGSFSIPRRPCSESFAFECTGMVHQSYCTRRASFMCTQLTEKRPVVGSRREAIAARAQTTESDGCPCWRQIQIRKKYLSYFTDVSLYTSYLERYPHYHLIFSLQLRFALLLARLNSNQNVKIYAIFSIYRLFIFLYKNQVEPLLVWRACVTALTSSVLKKRNKNARDGLGGDAYSKRIGDGDDE